MRSYVFSGDRRAAHPFRAAALRFFSRANRARAAAARSRSIAAWVLGFGEAVRFFAAMQGGRWAGPDFDPKKPPPRKIAGRGGVYWKVTLTRWRSEALILRRGPAAPAAGGRLLLVLVLGRELGGLALRLDPARFTVAGHGLFRLHAPLRVEGLLVVGVHGEGPGEHFVGAPHVALAGDLHVDLVADVPIERQRGVHGHREELVFADEHVLLVFLVALEAMDRVHRLKHDAHEIPVPVVDREGHCDELHAHLRVPIGREVELFLFEPRDFGGQLGGELESVGHFGRGLVLVVGHDGLLSLRVTGIGSCGLEARRVGLSWDNRTRRGAKPIRARVQERTPEPARPGATPTETVGKQPSSVPSSAGREIGGSPPASDFGLPGRAGSEALPRQAEAAFPRRAGLAVGPRIGREGSSDTPGRGCLGGAPGGRGANTPRTIGRNSGGGSRKSCTGR